MNHFKKHIFTLPITKHYKIFMADVAKFWSLLENGANVVDCITEHFCSKQRCIGFRSTQQVRPPLSREQDKIFYLHASQHSCLTVPEILPFGPCIFSSFQPYYYFSPARRCFSASRSFCICASAFPYLSTFLLQISANVRFCHLVPFRLKAPAFLCNFVYVHLCLIFYAPPYL